MALSNIICSFKYINLDVLITCIWVKNGQTELQCKQVKIITASLLFETNKISSLVLHNYDKYVCKLSKPQQRKGIAELWLLAL